MTHAAHLLDAGRDVMVQPYVVGVDSVGETGLVYFDGTFSHAFRKDPLLTPGAGGSRGCSPSRTSTPATRRRPNANAGEAVMDAVRHRFGRELLYARVDLLPDVSGQPLLLELELTEPSFFLSTDPDAAGRIAVGDQASPSVMPVCRPRMISTAPTATPTTARAATPIHTTGVPSYSSADVAGDDEADSASDADTAVVVVARTPVVVVGAAATVWLKASVLSGEIDVTRKFHVPGPGRAIVPTNSPAVGPGCSASRGEVGPGTVVPGDGDRGVGDRLGVVGVGQLHRHLGRSAVDRRGERDELRDGIVAVCSRDRRRGHHEDHDRGDRGRHVRPPPVNTEPAGPGRCGGWIRVIRSVPRRWWTRERPRPRR